MPSAVGRAPVAAFVVFALLGTTGFSIFSTNSIIKSFHYLPACKPEMKSKQDCYYAIADSITSTKGLIDASRDFDVEEAEAALTGRLLSLQEAMKEGQDESQFLSKTSGAKWDNERNQLTGMQSKIQQRIETEETIQRNATDDTDRLQRFKEQYSGVDVEFERSIDAQSQLVIELRKDATIRKEKLLKLSALSTDIESLEMEIERKKALATESIRKKEESCKIRGRLTCKEFKEIYGASRTDESDAIAKEMLTIDTIEGALSNKASFISDENRKVLSSTPRNKLETAQNLQASKVIKLARAQHLQNHEFCIQLREIMKNDVVLSMSELAINQPAIKEILLKINELVQKPATAWKPKYNYPGTFICSKNDSAIQDDELSAYARKNGMNGYISGLRKLTSQARLPTQYIGYLVGVVDENDYVVTQSFGNNSLASSEEDETPIIIAFGKQAALSEGSSLDGLYLKFVRIGTYVTSAGAPRNALFFSVFDIPSKAEK